MNYCKLNNFNNYVILVKFAFTKKGILSLFNKVVKIC
jgi:hypothetical protein